MLKLTIENFIFQYFKNQFAFNFVKQSSKQDKLTNFVKTVTINNK